MNFNLRRSVPILLMAIGVVALFALAIQGQPGGLSGLSFLPTATSLSKSGLPPAAVVSENSALFNPTVMHTILLSMTEEEANRLNSSFQRGRREFAHADVTIDDVALVDVGIRFNINLASLGWTGDPDAQGEAQNGAQPTHDPQTSDNQNQAGGNFSIPLLLRFDAFVDGQTCMGYRELVFTIPSQGISASMFVPPLVSFTARRAGLPGPYAAYAAVFLGEMNVLVTNISEIVDEGFLLREYNDPAGLLFRAGFGATLDITMANVEDITDTYRLDAGEEGADVTPLVDFLRFLDEADNETFQTGLPDLLDVDAFATYLAVNALLSNTSSMIGMSSGYCLYYAPATGLFTVLDCGSNGGLIGFPGDPDPEFDVMLPQAGGNLLLNRFLAIPEFRARYEDKLRLVYQQAFLEGGLETSLQILNGLVETFNAQHPDTPVSGLDQALAQMQDLVAQRAAYLETVALLNR